MLLHFERSPVIFVMWAGCKSSSPPSFFPGCEKHSRALEIDHIRGDGWLSMMGTMFVSYMLDELLGSHRCWWSMCCRVPASPERKRTLCFILQLFDPPVWPCVCWCEKHPLQLNSSSHIVLKCNKALNR